jgi:predicted RNA-binding Zn-ribbon protein involved in translation (DUF1610 family)
VSNKRCPKCGSSNVKLKTYWREVGGAAGGIVGTSLGAPMKIFGAAGGGALGKELGRLLGRNIDKHLTGKYKCKACGNKFYL